MPAPERGLYARLLSEERIPILDVGLIRALKRREVTVVPEVEGLELLVRAGQPEPGIDTKLLRRAPNQCRREEQCRW